MLARRTAILTAARRVFARKGFHATTIADLCREAGVSAGGLYTHFDSKHAIVAALGSEATTSGEQVDLLGLYRQLQSPSGALTAQLDLQLWAASPSDSGLRDQVEASLDAFRATLKQQGHGDSKAVLIEAVALGLEVQRALGRAGTDALDDVLSDLLSRSQA